MKYCWTQIYNLVATETLATMKQLIFSTVLFLESMDNNAQLEISTKKFKNSLEMTQSLLIAGPCENKPTILSDSVLAWSITIRPFFWILSLVGHNPTAVSDSVLVTIPWSLIPSLVGHNPLPVLPRF